MNLMDTSSVILIALSVGIPGFLTGAAAIVAVCRADKNDLVEIVRALMKMRTDSSAAHPEAGGPANTSGRARARAAIPRH
jgi:hypothetical protein